MEDYKNKCARGFATAKRQRRLDDRFEPLSRNYPAHQCGILCIVPCVTSPPQRPHNTISTPRNTQPHRVMYYGGARGTWVGIPSGFLYNHFDYPIIFTPVLCPVALQLPNAWHPVRMCRASNNSRKKEREPCASCSIFKRGLGI